MKEPKTYKCYICETRPLFYSLQAYKRHMKKHHKNKVGVIFENNRKK